jgi:hypothetical protein
LPVGTGNRNLYIDQIAMDYTTALMREWRLESAITGCILKGAAQYLRRGHSRPNRPLTNAEHRCNENRLAGYIERLRTLQSSRPSAPVIDTCCQFLPSGGSVLSTIVGKLPVFDRCWLSRRAYENCSGCTFHSEDADAHHSPFLEIANELYSTCGTLSVLPGTMTRRIRISKSNLSRAQPL